MENSKKQNFYNTSEELIYRDHLAIERTRLANERTLLAYIRTSLYLVTAGLGLTELELFRDLKIVGYVAFGLSCVVLMIGVSRFVATKKRLTRRK